MNRRPSWSELYMEMCETLAKRSTCLRIQTASLIVKDNIIVSVGYNGVPKGQEHCAEYWSTRNPYPTLPEWVESDTFYREHHTWSNENELHGEMNAILFAGKNNISVSGSSLYSLYSPCIQCAKAILTSGITHVYYKHVYKRSTQGLDMLYKHNVCVQQIE